MGEIMWELYWIFDIPQQNSNGFPLFGSHSLRKTNESNFPVSSRFWDFVRRKNASKSSTTRLNIEPISGCLIHHHPPLPAAPPLHVVQCPWTTPTPLLGAWPRTSTVTLFRWNANVFHDVWLFSEGGTNYSRTTMTSQWNIVQQVWLFTVFVFVFNWFLTGWQFLIKWHGARFCINIFRIYYPLVN